MAYIGALNRILQAGDGSHMKVRFHIGRPPTRHSKGIQSTPGGGLVNTNPTLAAVQAAPRRTHRIADAANADARVYSDMSQRLGTRTFLALDLRMGRPIQPFEGHAVDRVPRHWVRRRDQCLSRGTPGGPVGPGRSRAHGVPSAAFPER